MQRPKEVEDALREVLATQPDVIFGCGPSGNPPPKKVILTYLDSLERRITDLESKGND
ncbi:MAG TPA: hypothetical protein VGM37_11545 [Armatimonadota bacterium]|jgi:hypothetical protein